MVINMPMFVLGGVMMTLVCCLGLVGNLGTLVVMSRRSMRSSINCLLLGMVSCDIVFLFTYLMVYGLRGIYIGNNRALFYYHYHMYPVLVPILYPIGKAAQTMSVYLTVAVTLERWVAVCHPLRAKAVCTYSRACWCVFGTAVFSLAYIAPRFFEYTNLVVTRENETAYIPMMDPTYFTYTYHMIYRHWLYTFIMYIIPFTVLAVFNTCILRQVKRAQTRHARREIRLAIMLLVIVVVFFSCNMLPLIRNTLNLAGILKGDDPLIYMNDLLLTVNHTVNFMVYAIFSENFRRAFMDTFCACRQQRNIGDQPKSPTKSNNSLESTLSTTPTENFVIVEQ